MTENEWTRSIADKLEPVIAPLRISTLQKIPYLREIEAYSLDWTPVDREPESFETDMIIYEESAGAIVPRVIIESKLGTITTHDAITYSHKVEMHKAVTPFLRYGVMLGNRTTYPLPGRLYRHGTNFDFMFSFVGVEPQDYEWASFVELIQREVTYSWQLEEMLHESRKPDRKRYYMLEKQLVLEEMP